MLTIISGYDGFAGLRIIRMKEARPKFIDAGCRWICLGCGTTVRLRALFDESRYVITRCLLYADRFGDCHLLRPGKVFFSHTLLSKSGGFMNTSTK